jgi:hypothetical protein
MSFCSHSHITVDKELGTGKCHDCGANLKFDGEWKKEFDWYCCDYNITEMCQKAGCELPPRCFFCGKIRPVESGTLQFPEDPLALDLGNLWCEKIAEMRGEPFAHGASLDVFGRSDMHAWRAVARRAIELGAKMNELKEES